MNQSLQALIFENSYTLSNYLVKKWAEIAKNSINKNGKFTWGLSVGEDHIEFYSKLSSLKDFDLWNKTQIFLTDEKVDDTNTIKTNHQILKEYLLNDIEIPDENFHPLPGDLNNVDFDLVTLGIGKQGETAGVYPFGVKTYSLKYEIKSLSLTVLKKSKNLFFVATGKDKADIIKSILKDKNLSPATILNSSEAKKLYFLDKLSASRLNYGDSYSHEAQAILVNF